MNQTPRRIQWRAMTSVLIAASFLVLLVTGVVLFLAPPGRIANWTNWNILGLRKSEWAALHLCFSALFLCVTVFHLVFNWRPLVGYFKDRLTRRLSLRWEWIAALAVCVAVFAGTQAGIRPFSWLLTWNERVRQSWDDPRERAPLPHAELLTLAELAQQAGVDQATAAARLAAKGVTSATPDTVVQQLADAHRLSARQVFEIIAPPAQSTGGGRGFGGGHGGPGAGRGAFGGGGGAGGGPGRKTLAEFCADEKIMVADAVARLRAKGLQVTETMTLREIAVNHGRQRPSEVIELIRAQPE